MSVPRNRRAEVGLARFIVFMTQAAGVPTNYRHINVVELKSDATFLPTSIRSKQVARVLLRTKPLSIHHLGAAGFETFTRAEQVCQTMNRAVLSVQAAEVIPNGIQQLFNHLWSAFDDHSSNQPAVAS